MIDIRLLTDGNNLIGFRSAGHAGYADAGLDIVCSAVSALLINTVNSIESFTEDEFTVDEGDGLLSLQMKGEVSPESSLLLKSLELGLTSIEETYGTSFLKVGRTAIHDKGGV